MRVGGKPFRTLWLDESGRAVRIIDQTRLHHEFEIRTLTTVEETAHAIRSMQVRGAPLIGVAAAHGLWLALQDDPSDEALERAFQMLLATRPTAVNLRWALDRVRESARMLPSKLRAEATRALAIRMADEDVDVCRRIGEHGLEIIEKRWNERGRPERLNILTHCNAGWLATIDWGTALAPVFLARARGVPIHIWVDETRPRNQGFLTAWELAQEGVPHTIIVDNAGGHLMQRGLVDLCIVGTDRTTAQGDVCNKIGTYLKALAAHDNGVPFHVAAPSSSIDFGLVGGVREIPIEERAAAEIHSVRGIVSGHPVEARITPGGSEVMNPAFDVTPARLVTSLITERGVCAPSKDGIARLFSDRTGSAIR